MMLSSKQRCSSLIYTAVVRQSQTVLQWRHNSWIRDINAACARHARCCSDDFSARNATTAAERARSVTSFYFQNAIDVAAAKMSVRLMPATMMYSGKSSDGSHILRSAQYLHKELPIRIAHRIADFRGLPFIVGCNPTILAVHELYIKTFHIMSEYPPVTDTESEIEFTQTLKQVLDDHKDVVTMLAEGIKATKKHIQDEDMMTRFLDRTLTSRLGNRLLCEHHLLLHEDSPNFVGIICINFSPKTLIEKKIEATKKIVDAKYGRCPDVRITGHLNTTFPYIPQPLDYILHEMLKNAMRATVETHDLQSDRLPPVTVSIASNDIDFIIRISDRGGGIRHDLMRKVWNYGFTTGNLDENIPNNGGPFDIIMENRAAGVLYGYGFGLPACKAYVEFLGGTLTLESMQGIGCDVYIRLRHIDGKTEGFRI